MGQIPVSLIPFFRVLLPILFSSVIITTAITYAITDYIFNNESVPTYNQKKSYKWIKNHMIGIIINPFGLMGATSIIQFLSPNSLFTYLSIIFITLGLIYATVMVTYGLNLEQHFSVKTLLNKNKTKK